MPGIATMFQALELSIDQLGADPQLEVFAKAMKAHPGYAHFGALGASIADFLPVDPVSGTQPVNYVRIWKNICGILADRGGRPGFLNTLVTLRDSLALLSKIADDEDVVALAMLSDDDKDRMKKTGDDL